MNKKWDYGPISFGTSAKNSTSGRIGDRSIMPFMIDIFVSLLLTALISIGVKRYFGDSGLAGFPVLTYVTITVLSFFVTSWIHSMFFPSASIL